MKILKKTNFYTNLFEKNSIPNIYNLEMSGINTMIPSEIKEQLFDDKTCVFHFDFFPNYLDFKIEKLSSYNLIKIEQKLGFAINLKGHISAADYLKTQCSTQHKKNITRAVNRLESSFNIKYITFYGSIEYSQYILAMNSLRQMIKKRFQVREGENKILKNWQHYLETTYRLINEKKASLFVIYNNDKPIEVSINYHYDAIMYSAISSFDLDYGKFSLGNIEIFKQLEWCLSNNITFFDMGYGDLEYKRKWSNQIYKFESHIISQKLKLLALIYSKYLTLKYKLIDYLISKNINNKFYTFINKLRKPKTNNTRQYKFEIEVIEKLSFNNITEVNINTNNYAFLRRPIYDFVYKYKEHVSSLKIYNISNTNSFIVLGKNNNIKITPIS